MLITHFNKFCQKHSRAAFIVIGLVIIVPFIFLWGSPRDFLRGRQGPGNVGEIYGRSIDHESFMKKMKEAELAIFLRYGQWIGEDNKSFPYWVQETLRRMRAMHEAKRRGLTLVSDSEVAKAIKAQWVLQDKSGKFAGDTFTLFKNNILKPRGIDGPGFDAIIRENIIIERLESQATTGVLVSPEEVRQEFNRNNETYVAQICTLNYLDFLKLAETSPTPAEIEAYFKANQAEFATKDAATPELTDPIKAEITRKLQDEVARKFYQEHVDKFRAKLAGGKTPDDLKKSFAAELEKLPGTTTDEQKKAMIQDYDREINTYLQPYFVPEQKKIRAAVFSFAPHKAQITVTDEQIQNYYDKHKADYSKEEVHAQHILLKLAPDATAEQKQAKRKELEEIRDRIQKGADFAAQARQFSEDPGSKDNGGDLDYFARGKMVEPFDKAAFALQKDELSPVVETNYGLHLIKCLDKRSGRPLEEVRQEIQGKLIDEEARKRAEQAALAFSDALFRGLDAQPDTTPAADLFSKVAADEKVEVKDSEWFRNRGAIQPFGYETDLIRQGEKLSALRPVTDVVKGRECYYVACWLATKPPYLPEISSDPALIVRVRNQINRERAIGLAREKARQAFADVQQKLQAGTAFAEAVKGLELNFPAVPAFSRQKPPERIAESWAILDAIASHGPNSMLPPIETGNGAVLVYLLSKTPPPESDFAKEKDKLVTQLKQQKESQALQNFYKKLEDESKTVLAEHWKSRSSL